MPALPAGDIPGVPRLEPLWGKLEACASFGPSVAAEAKVRRLYLYHHDPYHDDEIVAAKEAAGRKFFADRGLEIDCQAAAEGLSISV